MKTQKRIIALIACVSLLAVSLLIQSPTDTYAKTKKVTLKVGQTKQLSASGIGKVKWSSSNKKVASVSKKGKVTAKKAGTAKITAKGKKKKMIFKVTVKNVTTTPSASTPVVNNPVINQPVSTVPTISTDQLAANISVTAEATQPITNKKSDYTSGLNCGIILTVTNNNSIEVDNVKISYKLVTSSDVSVQADSINLCSIKAGGTVKGFIYLKEDQTALVDLTKSSFSKTVENNAYNNDSDLSGMVSVTQQKGLDSKIALTVKNNSPALRAHATVLVFFKDAANRIISVEDAFFSLDPNETKFEDVKGPCYWDDDFNDVPYAVSTDVSVYGYLNTY